MCLVFTQIFLMESVSSKWLLLSFLCLSWAHSPFALEELNGAIVKGVNLGGWLVLEGFITPSLFEGIPNPNMLDGQKVQFKSLILHKFVSAKDGGGSSVAIDQEKAITWETFRLWRVSPSEFQLRTDNGHFLSCDGNGAPVTAKSNYPPSPAETFTIERFCTSCDDKRVRIKHSSGSYLQASSGNELRADHEGIPGWEDNAAIFKMIFGEKMRGDYQLGNGYGPYGYEEAKKVLDEHRSSYVTREDFEFLSSKGINTVRIPVGWWIKDDSNPEPPYIGGSAEYLQKAFEWAKEYNIKCIIDLHAARGSQNGNEHSASRDGTIDWPKYNEHIQESLKAIEFLASNYGTHPALLGIELLNEPVAPEVSLDVLKPYYSEGYKIVRKYSPGAYVLISQRIKTGNLFEIYKAEELKNLPKLVVDFHFYNLYDKTFWNKSPSENIQYIKNKRRRDVESLNAYNGPLVFVGEWVNTFGINDPGTDTDLQDYSKAQLEVYGSASFGWAYWTLKTETAPRWDLKKNIEKQTLQLL